MWLDHCLDSALVVLTTADEPSATVPTRVRLLNAGWEAVQRLSPARAAEPRTADDCPDGSSGMARGGVLGGDHQQAKHRSTPPRLASPLLASPPRRRNCVLNLFFRVCVCWGVGGIIGFWYTERM